MKSYLLYAVRGLVEHPRAVTIGEIAGAQTSVFEVRCHADDRGRLIGRNGRTIGALRTLAHASAQRHHRRAILELAE